MSTATLEFPHLTDTARVRAEATQQYGELDNAAAFVLAHKASRDPNVEAAQLKQINVEATEEVTADLEENGMDSIAQKKIDEAYGEGKFVVIAASVRGAAMTAIGESTQDKRTHKLVAGWTSKWKPIVETQAQRNARINAASEVSKGRLGAEARAEVERMLDKALDKALGSLGALLAEKKIEVDGIRSAAIAEGMAAVDDDEDDETVEDEAAKTAEGEGGETTEDDDGDDGEVEEPKAVWPKTKADLKALATAKKVDVDLKNSDTVAEMIAKLEAAGVKPPTAE